MRLTKKDIARFHGRYVALGKSKCWEWNGERNEKGRARIYAAGAKRCASHVALHLDGRPRPSTAACALHSCDNPGCVNPSHIRWGTQLENIADREQKGRGGAVRGVKQHAAKLKDEDVILIRADNRHAALIAQNYNISQATVYAVRRGATWRHV